MFLDKNSLWALAFIIVVGFLIFEKTIHTFRQLKRINLRSALMVLGTCP